MFAIINFVKNCFGFSSIAPVTGVEINTVNFADSTTAIVHWEVRGTLNVAGVTAVFKVYELGGYEPGVYFSSSDLSDAPVLTLFFAKKCCIMAAKKEILIQKYRFAIEETQRKATRWAARKKD